MASLGNIVQEPEPGWKRYDDNNENNEKVTNLNMQHYYIECEGKKYIPTKQFWNDNLNGFVPVEDFIIKDINNEYREFLLDIKDILYPIDVGSKSVIPIEVFRNKNFKICKFIGSNEKWNLENKSNINNFNNKIKINYKMKSKILNQCFIKFLEYICNFDFVKYNYTLKSDCSDIKIALFHNGEYYGKDFKVIPKNDIINNGFDINELSNENIPFSNFKIIALINGNEYLKNISLYKRLKPISKLINKKKYNVYYDDIEKRIYIIFNSGKIKKLKVNKLHKYKDNYGIINSLEDIEERS